MRYLPFCLENVIEIQLHRKHSQLTLYFYRNGSMSSEEIVPDLTVKSASSTNILTRFPSDLLETSVDPDNEAKGILSSDASNLPKTSNHSEIDIPLSSTIFESSDPSITGLDNKISDDKTTKRTKELNVMMEKEVSNKAIHISSSTLESLDSDSMQISVKKEPTMTIPNNEKTSSIPYTNDKTSLLNSNLETETPKVVSTELVSVQKSKLEETTKDSYQQSLEVNLYFVLLHIYRPFLNIANSIFFSSFFLSPDL